VNIKKVFYSGSFTRWIHGEEDPKGFYDITYDEKLGLIIEKAFIENKEAPLFVSVPCISLGSSIKDIHQHIEKYSNVDSLRIVVPQGTDESILRNIMAAAKEYKNVVVFKQKNKNDVGKKDTEVPKEYVEKLKLYKDLSFIETTIKFAEEELGKKITKDNIDFALQNQ